MREQKWPEHRNSTWPFGNQATIGQSGHPWRIAFAILSIGLVVLLVSQGVLAASSPRTPRKPALRDARALSDAGARTEFVPSSLELDAGETVTVALMVFGVQDMFGYQLRMTFDPTVLEIADADPTQPGINVAPGDFIQPVYMPVNECDNAAGTVTVVATQVGGAPRSGDGRLLSLILRAKGEGASPIHFAEVLLVGEAGMGMAAQTEEPLYVVTGSLEQDPTLMPTATATSTATPNGATATPTPNATVTPTPSAPAIPYLYLDPQVLQLNPGETGQVTIRTSYIQDLSGLELHLAWDPTLLEVIDADPTKNGVQVQPGNLFAGYWTIQPGAGNQADNATGDLFYALALTSNPPVASGEWSVAVVTFRALSNGSCALDLHDWMLAREGLDIPSDAFDGQAFVGETPPPAPTATLTPTATQTPPPTIPVTETPTTTPTVVPTGAAPVFVPLTLRNAS